MTGQAGKPDCIRITDILLADVLIFSIIKTFQKESLCIAKVERKDKNGKDKGSISMLQEWLKKNVTSNFGIDEVIVNPIKYIRKIRQVPAH